MDLKSTNANQHLDCLKASKRNLSSVFAHITSTILTTTAFVIFMLINAKRSNDYVVDMNKCSCSCFDRQFKGHHYHESKQYRHIYFNLTPSAALAFLWCTGHFILLWAYVSRAVSCLAVTLRCRDREASGGLRLEVLGLGSVSLYGLVYGWWVVFNYINDAHYLSEIGVLWPTQLFFSATDLVSAYTCYRLLAVGDEPSNETMRISVTIAAAHIVLALCDQGLQNILSFRPLFARDMMFLLSDLASLM